MNFLINNKRLVLALLLVFTIFGYLRFTDLSARPMHNDEGVNGYFTLNLLRSNTYKYDPTNYHGPTLYYFQLVSTWATEFLKDPLHFKFRDVSGLTVFSTRFTIACAGLLFLAGFLCCRSMLGPWGMWVALLFSGLSCNFLFYSRYFIHETYVLLFTSGIVLSCWWYGQTKLVRYVYLAVASAALLFCTKETSVLHFGVLVMAYAGANAKNLKEQLRLQFSPLVRDFPFLSLLAVSIWALFFSSFFTNFGGLEDSFRAYAPWIKQGLKSGHEKVWTYYITTLLVPYEFGLVVLTLVSAVVVIIKNQTRGLFFLFWTFGTFVVYSTIPYKTPWLIVNIILPMVFLSAHGVQLLIDWIGQMPDPTMRRRGKAALITIMGGCLLVSIPATWRANYIEWDNERHPQIYVHTSRDIYELLRIVNETARVTGQNNKLLIQVYANEYWPIPFYLKEYPEAKFWGKLLDSGDVDAPIIIANSNQHAEIRHRVKDPYSIRILTLHPGYYLDVWQNQRTLAPFLIAPPTIDLQKSANPGNIQPGLKRDLWPGYEINGQPAQSKKGPPNISFFFENDSQKPMAPPYTLRWTGFIKIPKSGVVRFAVDSDDGSRLILDGMPVIDNSGNHPVQRGWGQAHLSSGYHRFELLYSDVGGFSELGLFWILPGGKEEPVPASAFFTE